MYVHITAQHHEDGLIPNFFREVWKRKHGMDPILAIKKDTNRVNNGITTLVLALVLILAGYILIVSYGIHDWKGYPFIGLGLGSLMWSVQLLLISHTDPKIAEYFNSLSELFTKFRIHPSTELGKMSREEFASNIDAMLKKGGAHIDRLVGFDKAKLRSEFKDGHAVALTWELCNERWDSYFPKKEKRNLISQS
jgi:hypothetical protein